jgi:hypothetical protein
MVGTVRFTIRKYNPARDQAVLVGSSIYLRPADKFAALRRWDVAWLAGLSYSSGCSLPSSLTNGDQLTLSPGNTSVHKIKHKAPAVSTFLCSVGISNVNEDVDDQAQPTQMHPMLEDIQSG